MAKGCDRREVWGCAVDHSGGDVNRNGIAHQGRKGASGATTAALRLRAFSKHSVSTLNVLVIGI
jgi:hypothetical protein